MTTGQSFAAGVAEGMRATPATRDQLYRVVHWALTPKPKVRWRRRRGEWPVPR